MESIKEHMIKIIKEQPNDSSFGEILRELVFAKMIERGIDDSNKGRTVSNQEMGRKIKVWQKAELDKRYKEYKSGKLTLHEWSKVHEELRRKHKHRLDCDLVEVQLL